MIFEQVKKLIAEEDSTISNDRIHHWCAIVESRLCLRLGADSLPANFIQIAVEICIKLFRRYYYEGISNENDGGLSVSFVEDILSEYSADISAYKIRKGTNGGTVRFL